MHICVFPKLKVKRQIKTLQGAPKEGSFLYFDYFSSPNANKSAIKAFCEVSLVSLTLKAAQQTTNLLKI